MNKYYADSIPARIKTAHAHVARSQALVDEGNEYAIPMLESAKRELEKLLSEAAEADIPAEVISEATSYRPVSKLREEIVELNRRVSHYQEMLEKRDADRQSLREEVAAFQAVQVGMQREYEDLYATLNRAKARFGGIATVAVFLGMVWCGFQVLDWLGLATSSPMAFVAMLGTAFVGTLATMVAIDASIDG